MTQRSIDARPERRAVEISASIMCIDWLHVAGDLDVLSDEGIEYLHLDVIDGMFAPDFAMGTSIINRIREHSPIRSDYHLMVEEPNRIFDTLEISVGDFVTIHQECCRNLHRDIVRLRRMGAKPGVAICPGTSLDTLEYVIEDVDLVLVMTVNPGFKGQRLVPQTLRKVEKLRRMIEDMSFDIRIAVDGNVNYENIPAMVEAGADMLIGGSSGLFRRDMPLEDAIARFRAAIGEGLEKRYPRAA